MKLVPEKMSIGRRIRTLFRSVGYVYKQEPLLAPLRDIAFITGTFLEMLMIKLGGLFIDGITDILTEWDRFSLTEFFYTDAFQYFAFMTAGWIVMHGLASIRDYATFKVSRTVWTAFDYDVVEKIESENLQEIEQPAFQELLTFVPMYSRDRIIDVYQIFTDIVNYLIKTISALIILSQTMQWSVFFLIVIAIAEPFIETIYNKKLNKFRFKEIEDIKYIKYLWNQSLRIPNFAELKVDGIFKTFKKELLKCNVAYYKGLTRIFKHSRMDKTFFAMIGQVLKRGYQVYIFALSIASGRSIGEFKALFDYADSGYGGAYWTWRSFSDIFIHLSYVDKFFELLDYEGFGDVHEGDKKVTTKGTPSLKLLSLDFAYPDDGIKVLEDVNLEIKPGEKVALIGGDGSGKSTIVKTLCGLYEIVAGDYMIDNLSIRELARGELKNRMSVMFQDFVRYNMTIRHNITMSDEKVKLNTSLYERVRKVAMVDDFMATENINDRQILGKHFKGGKEISPGYWQRIAIARMLYRNRSINMMDEPFTFIDGLSRAQILDGVFEFLGEDKTLIYITQDTDHLQKFDTVYFFVNGKIAESGTYKELMKKKGAFYKATRYNV